MPDPTPKMRHWETTRFYDPIADADSIRYSGFSGSGVYWISEPLTGAGKSRRAQRERLLDRISRAIERGDEPGEVRDDTDVELAVSDPLFDPSRF